MDVVQRWVHLRSSEQLPEPSVTSWGQPYIGMLGWKVPLQILSEIGTNYNWMSWWARRHETCKTWPPGIQLFQSRGHLRDSCLRDRLRTYLLFRKSINVTCASSDSASKLNLPQHVVPCNQCKSVPVSDRNFAGVGLERFIPAHLASTPFDCTYPVPITHCATYNNKFSKQCLESCYMWLLCVYVS